MSLILAILKPSVSLIHRNPVFNFTKYKNPNFKSKMLVININEYIKISESLFRKLSR